MFLAMAIKTIETALVGQALSIRKAGSFSASYNFCTHSKDVLNAFRHNPAVCCLVTGSGDMESSGRSKKKVNGTPGQPAAAELPEQGSTQGREWGGGSGMPLCTFRL